jgi:tetratricopeptide (TPR) repeat protein
MEPTMKRILAPCLTVLSLLLFSCTTGVSAELRDGWKLVLAEDYIGARDKYEAVLVKYPDNPYALLNLGFVYQKLGDYKSSREKYEAAIVHGGNAEVTQVVVEGSVSQRKTTVADKARENLKTLPN